MKTLNIKLFALFTVLILISCGDSEKDLEAFSGPEITMDMADLNLKVTGMTCSDCPREVRDAIMTVDGVKEVRVDFADSTAKIILTDKNLDPQKLIEAIRVGDSHSEFDAKVRKENNK